MIDRKEVELSVEHIRDYAHNRKKWLDEIMEYHNCTAEQAKRLVLIAMHGGNPNHAKHLKEMPQNSDCTHPWVQQLCTELEQARCVVVRAKWSEYEELIEAKRKSKIGDHDLFRSVFAIMTHEQEHKVMAEIREHLCEAQVRVFSLIHDGLIASECNEELLRTAELRVLDKTGYSIRLAEKPLFGKQDDPIPELAPLEHIPPKEGDGLSPKRHTRSRCPRKTHVVVPRKRCWSWMDTAKKLW